MIDLNTFKDHQFLDVTTSGRRSGQGRAVELWFVVYQDQVYVMAEHHQATGWVKNLQKSSAASVALAGNTLSVRARILSPDEDKLEWQAVAQQFQNKYGWSAGLPVALESGVE
jgi:deazaflavin-dependent oxidoreductase (nitroreductase family)